MEQYLIGGCGAKASTGGGKKKAPPRFVFKSVAGLINLSEKNRVRYRFLVLSSEFRQIVGQAQISDRKAEQAFETGNKSDDRFSGQTGIRVEILSV